MPQLPGLIKGLGVTARTAGRTLFPARMENSYPSATKGAVTVQYPHEKETTYARGVIALHEELHRLHALFSFMP